MEETKQYLVTDGPIRADRTYRNGEEIGLDARCAARLLKGKKIFPVISAGEKAGGEKEGQKGKEDDSLKDKTKGSNKGGKK